MLEAWKEEISMAIWIDHFETLPQKIKFEVLLNLQFLELELKELLKELKKAFLGERRTFLIIILFALDDIQEGKLTRLLS